jgi:MFS family permease
VLVLAPRFGLRTLVAFGIVFMGLQYPVLAEVHGVDLMLLLFCLIVAIGDVFYWTCYHAYFAALGDSEHRGQQIGAREALAAAAAIVGPLVGGWALTVLGPRIAFGAAAIVHLLAALPLLATPDVRVAKSMPGAFRAAFHGTLLFAADGWMVAGYFFVWQIALFVVLKEDFASFGGVLALTGVVGAIGGLILGRHIDAGYGQHAVWLTFATVAGTTVLRAAATENVGLAVVANAMGALVGCVYLPTLMTTVYNQAKRSPCVFRYHFVTEGGWDIGGALGCLAAAILSAAGAPLSYGILLSLAGTALSLVVLQRCYAVPRITA